VVEVDEVMVSSPLVLFGCFGAFAAKALALRGLRNIRSKELEQPA
jgi:hypothetical protein